MDRPPEDPAPGDSAPEEPVAPSEPADPPAPVPEPLDPEVPAQEAAPLVPPGSEAIPPVPQSPYGPPGYAQYAPPAASDALPAAPVAPVPAPKDGRPGAGPGVATGCGLQVLAFILFSVTGGLMIGFLGSLWPFILVTIGSALLMLSKRWRRFATGALIVSAATWIVVIGPCIALLSGSF